MRNFPSAWSTALMTLTLIMLAIACTKSWRAVPDPNVVSSYLHCKEYSSDAYQMLFVPGYAATTIVVEDCNLFRRERVSIALSAFEKAWSERFGTHPVVKSNLRDMLITFGTAPKTVSAAYDMDGRLVNDAVLGGQTFTKSIIWVYVDTGMTRVCDTSLVHELVHTSLWAAGAERGDPDHLGREYYGWNNEHNLLIQDVNRYLCSLGI